MIPQLIGKPLGGDTDCSTVAVWLLTTRGGNSNVMHQTAKLLQYGIITLIYNWTDKFEIYY